MIRLLILGLLVINFYYFYYKRRKIKKFIGEAKRFIAAYQLDSTVSNEKTSFSEETKGYWFDRGKNILNAITGETTNIDMNELLFTEFPIFKNYIQSEEPKCRIFSQKRRMFLFYPIINEDKTTEFFVFERAKIVSDDFWAFINS